MSGQRRTTPKRESYPNPPITKRQKSRKATPCGIMEPVSETRAFRRRQRDQAAFLAI